METDHTLVERRLLDEVLRPGAVALDAGCGRTTRLRDYRDRIARLVGVDADEEAGRANPYLDEFLPANLEEPLPFEDDSFDLVYANFVVEHLGDPERAFAEWRRVLRPDGAVVLLTTNRASPFVAAASLLPQRARLTIKRRGAGAAERDVYPTRYAANTPERLRAVAAAAGFEPVSVVLVGTIHRYGARIPGAAPVLEGDRAAAPGRIGARRSSRASGLFESCKSLQIAPAGSGTLVRAVVRLAFASALAALAAALVIAPSAARRAGAALPGSDLRVGRRVHAARPDRDPRRARAEPGRALSTPPDALERSPSSGARPLSSMQRRLGSQATMVGVNGDFSRFADGNPSGILLRDGVLVAPPNSQRSSAGFGLDGALDVRRVKFLGTWRGTGQRRAVNEFNDAPGKNGLALFTSDYGSDDAADRELLHGRPLALPAVGAEHRPRRSRDLVVQKRARAASLRARR